MSEPVSMSSERPGNEWGSASTPFDGLGGEAGVRALVDRFYDIVDADSPVLRAMLPANDTTSRRKLFEYLVEWTGGPSLYSPHRGHPMMRRRHLPFEIGPFEVTEWLRCMRQAMDDRGVDGALRCYLDARIEALARHMQNVD